MDLDAEAKKENLKHFFKGIWKGKSPAPKLRNSADKSLSQPWCSHSNMMNYDVRCPAAKDNSITYYARSRRAKHLWRSHYNARLPSNSGSWRCENEAFVRDFPQNLKEDVMKEVDAKTRLSCETCLKTLQWKMWKRSFRARPLSKSERGRCENEAFVRDLLQNLKVEDVKTKLSCETSFKSLKVEDVKTKLSCETSLKIWTLKMWKRSFRARPLSKSESGRCENEAVVARPLRNLKDQIVKMKPKLSVPMRGRSENDPGLNERVPQPPAGQASPSIFRGMFRPAKHGSLCIR